MKGMWRRENIWKNFEARVVWVTSLLEKAPGSKFGLFTRGLQVAPCNKAILKNEYEDTKWYKVQVQWCNAPVWKSYLVPDRHLYLEPTLCSTQLRSASGHYHIMCFRPPRLCRLLCRPDFSSKIQHGMHIQVGRMANPRRYLQRGCLHSFTEIHLGFFSQAK